MSIPGMRVDLPLPVGALSKTQKPGDDVALMTSSLMESMGSMISNRG
jgi:hypothetical protein